MTNPIYKHNPKRPKSDFYPTIDTDVTRALLDWLDLPEMSTVWEPACGEGHMAETLSDHGMLVHATTLEDMGYGETFWDFTSGERPAHFDWIITNPPFSQGAPFIRQAAKHGKPFAFLFKAHYWNAANRIALFTKIRPTHVLPLTWRPNFYPLDQRTKNGPTLDVAWYVWKHLGATTTEFELLRKPEAA